MVLGWKLFWGGNGFGVEMVLGWKNGFGVKIFGMKSDNFHPNFDEIVTNRQKTVCKLNLCFRNTFTRLNAHYFFFLQFLPFKIFGLPNEILCLAHPRSFPVLTTPWTNSSYFFWKSTLSALPFIDDHSSSSNEKSEKQKKTSLSLFFFHFKFRFYPWTNWQRNKWNSVTLNKCDFTPHDMFAFFGALPLCLYWPSTMSTPQTSPFNKPQTENPKPKTLNLKPQKTIKPWNPTLYPSPLISKPSNPQTLKPSNP